MGSGSYSTESRQLRATTMAFATNTIEQNFKQKQINNAMNPHGIKLRESCDSEEHPNSLGIIIALDVTGSMGTVPQHLVQKGLPHVMESILKAGVKDPQVLFLGIGDHECDKSPLQVGQFESSDELLDKWLTDVYIESGGGGNEGESYLLAWYFGAKHTSLDCFKKRSEKGFLFTIGDEPCLGQIPKADLKGIMGPGQYDTVTHHELLEQARKTYHVFHINIAETFAGSRQETQDGWKQLMGDNVIIAKRHQEVSDIIAKVIKKHSKNNSLTEQEKEAIIL